MKGVLFPGDREVKVKEFPLPTPGVGEVRVAMRAAGLCGSDLGYLYRLSKEERKKPRLGILSSPTIIPGHEPCGVVDEVGEGVTTLKVGDRVVVYHISGCGTCKYCRAGWGIHCPHKKTYGFDINGAFADFMVAKERDCIILPPELSFADGAYCACGAGTAYKVLNRLGISGIDTLAIFGLGPVGLAGVFFGRMMAGRVIGVDIVDDRLELASKIGAHHVLHGDKDNIVETIMDITKGIGADVAVDCSANPLARNQALDCTKTWGKAAFVGEGNKTTIDPSLQIIHKQLTLIGSWVFSISDLRELLDFLVRNQLSLNPIITHRFTLDDAPEALEIFDKGHTGKAIFEWGE